jgi:hypothetical protein
LGTGQDIIDELCFSVQSNLASVLLAQLLKSELAWVSVVHTFKTVNIIALNQIQKALWASTRPH